MPRAATSRGPDDEVVEESAAIADLAAGGRPDGQVQRPWGGRLLRRCDAGLRRGARGDAARPRAGISGGCRGWQGDCEPARGGPGGDELAAYRIVVPIATQGSPSTSCSTPLIRSGRSLAGLSFQSVVLSPFPTEEIDRYVALAVERLAKRAGQHGSRPGSSRPRPCSPRRRRRRPPAGHIDPARAASRSGRRNSGRGGDVRLVAHHQQAADHHRAEIVGAEPVRGVDERDPVVAGSGHLGGDPLGSTASGEPSCTPRRRRCARRDTPGSAALGVVTDQHDARRRLGQPLEARPVPSAHSAASAGYSRTSSRRPRDLVGCARSKRSPGRGTAGR